MEGINSIPVYPPRIIYKVFLEKEISGLVLREISDGNFSPGRILIASYVLSGWLRQGEV